MKYWGSISAQSAMTSVDTNIGTHCAWAGSAHSPWMMIGRISAQATVHMTKEPTGFSFPVDERLDFSNWLDRQLTKHPG